MHIIVFGDSITYGAWDPDGGWAQRLRRFLDQKTLADPENYYYILYNLGVSGDTTNEMLKRLKSETAARVNKNEETMFIFSVGSNDACILNSEKRTVTTEYKFRKNIESMISTARKFTKKIVFTGLTPVNESMTNPIPWAPDFSSRNDVLKKFDLIIRDVCAKQNVPFVETFSALAADDLHDGDHPKPQGHEKIFNLVMSTLIDKKLL